MITTMITFMYVSTVLAMASTALLCINYLIKEDSVIDYAIVNKYIKTCRTASLTFTFFAWLVNSFDTTSNCLKGYSELSAVCARLGYFWIIYAFVCVAICILMVSIKKKNALIDNISKFRNTGFFMGAVFLIVSFLLDV